MSPSLFSEASYLVLPPPPCPSPSPNPAFLAPPGAASAWVSYTPQGCSRGRRDKFYKPKILWGWWGGRQRKVRGATCGPQISTSACSLYHPSTGPVPSHPLPAAPRVWPMGRWVKGQEGGGPSKPNWKPLYASQLGPQGWAGGLRSSLILYWEWRVGGT